MGSTDSHVQQYHQQQQQIKLQLQQHLQQQAQQQQQLRQRQAEVIQLDSPDHIDTPDHLSSPDLSSTYDQLGSLNNSVDQFTYLPPSPISPRGVGGCGVLFLWWLWGQQRWAELARVSGSSSAGLSC